MTTLGLNKSEFKTFRIDFENMIEIAKRKLLILNVNESVNNILNNKAKKFKKAEDAFEFLNN